MNRHLAHLLRRTARKLIAWSNRLDAPVVEAEAPGDWLRQAMAQGVTDACR